MDQFQNSVMIALLPTTSDWCSIPLPHLTLAYTGEIPNLPPSVHNELLKAAVNVAQASDPLTIDVVGTDIFGSDDLVDVILLRPTEELFMLHKMVSEWDISDHEFTPHVTVGPMGSLKDSTPQQLTFYRVMLSWGTENTSYPLRRLF